MGWLLGVFLWLAPLGSAAWALIINGTNGNTSAPTAANLSEITGGSSFNYFNNVGISSTGGASFTYLGDGWCMTASHVTIGNQYGHLAFSQNFDTQATLTITGNNSYGIATPNVDLRLFHIDQVPDLPALTISNSTPTAGFGSASQVILVGNGVGAQVNGGGNPLQYYWNNVNVAGNGTVTLGSSTTTPPSSVTNPLPAPFPNGANPGTYQASGFMTAGSNTIRWGTNLVSGSATISYSSFTDSAFYTTYNDPVYAPFGAETYESQITTGDSGGGMFHYNTGTSQWELAGINVISDSFALTGTVLYGDSSFAVDLSQYKSQILSAIAAVPIAGWTGTADGNWSNASNWNTGVIPGSTSITTSNT